MEHEVSVSSGQSVIREADTERFEVVPFGVTRNGAWLTPAETRTRLERVSASEHGDVGDDAGSGILGYPEVLAALREMDVVFPLVHGTFGEDGTLQGLFELADLPYVGSGVGSSAVGMDKELMRSVFAAAGIPQPSYIVLTDRDLENPPEQAIQFVERELGYPCFVKPCNGGSSVGVSKVASREDLHDAVARAAQHDRKVMVEAAMSGHEVECAVLGNESPMASGVAEIVTSGEFYTYESKYLDDSAQVVVPAPISEVTRERVRELALRAFRAVDCAGLARVDFFADNDGDEPQVIEINTLPGFTPISMFPQLWQEEGLSYSDLISRLVDLALERHAERAIRELRREAS
jgi:D-alanine-D-alanine ligase